MNILELSKLETPHVYQPRLPGRVEVGKARRYCRCCNSIIPKNTKHLTLDGHLSSGYRSNVHICHECLLRKAGETK